MEALENILFQQLASVCSESRQAFDQHIGMSQSRRQLLALLAETGEYRRFEIINIKSVRCLLIEKCIFQLTSILRFLCLLLMYTVSIAILICELTPPAPWLLLRLLFNWYPVGFELRERCFDIFYL